MFTITTINLNNLKRTYKLTPIGNRFDFMLEDQWQKNWRAKDLFSCGNETMTDQRINLPIQCQMSTAFRNAYPAMDNCQSLVLIVKKTENENVWSVSFDTRWLPPPVAEKLLPKGAEHQALLALLSGEIQQISLDSDPFNPSPKVWIRIQSLFGPKIAEAGQILGRSELSSPMSDEEVVGRLTIFLAISDEPFSVRSVLRFQEKNLLSDEQVYRCIGRMVLAGHRLF